ncbi:T9SS type A sorting domain-containing protein [candidate division KSB1 bacterium]|nr:T9SS type A sorting domain-containing protein [candidate division KSB1 bacterium]
MDDTLPESFVLNQNYPNPFNPSTTIEYSLSIDAHAVVRVYNLQGQEIVTLINEKKDRGTYSITWDGRNANGQPVASGFYYFHLKAADFSATRKMILLR